MEIDIIDWDDEDDLQGNLWHIIGPGELPQEDVEDVLYGHRGKIGVSNSTGI